jgi:tyrosyl-tRNA synthetase
MTDIEAKSRFALIKENLSEVLNPEIIENILAEGRHPKIYWGESRLQPRCCPLEVDGGSY